MRTLPWCAILLVSILCASVAEDAAPRAGTTRDIIPCANAHYSFGTAVTTNGLVLFTEFNHRQIRSWNPQTRRLEVWRAAKTPGMFGLATGTGGDVFVGMDLGDKGNPGKVLRIRSSTSGGDMPTPMSSKGHTGVQRTASPFCRPAVVPSNPAA